MNKIMFNDKYGLTESVLKGNKTVTRRVMPDTFFVENEVIKENNSIYFLDKEYKKVNILDSKYNRFKIGDIVAIAQSYETIYNDSNLETMDTLVKSMKNCPGWKNKMFVSADKMNHFIKIIDVKCERLNDISDEDCLKEGIVMKVNQDSISYSFKNSGKDFSSPKEAYAELIDKIGPKGTWNLNPYVMVYYFELI